ncbi:MAG TPA: GreA/GreB family elongation factor [Dongiaceae bacterium]|nr:GreA/GreB family elongation factor [Dongiaceae bacterium]
MKAYAHAAAGLPPITMTIGNFRDLHSLLRTRAGERSWKADAILARELQRSILMHESQIPADVATMRSRVQFRIAGTDLAQTATLVYPGESHLYDDAISVLTPLGSAILGLTEGQSIPHTAPDGASIRITVLYVLHQPEAACRHDAADIHEEIDAPELESA